MLDNSNPRGGNQNMHGSRVVPRGGSSNERVLARPDHLALRAGGARRVPQAQRRTLKRI